MARGSSGADDTVLHCAYGVAGVNSGLGQSRLWGMNVVVLQYRTGESARQNTQTRAPHVQCRTALV